MFRYQNTSSRPYRFSIFLLMSLIISITFISRGQTPQLSLADILVGLRSKKVTIAERNTLLTDAVKTRGITFTLTPEIERELVNTGAGLELVWAIREKSPKIKIIQTPTPLPTPEPTPILTPTPTPIPTPSLTPTPTPPDSAFYRTQAAANILNAKYDLAVADYDKALEISPKDSMTYFFRGDAYEKIGDVEKAVADYQKAVELDENNEPAKNNLWRLLTEKAKRPPSSQTKELTKINETVAVPLSVEVGELNSYAINLVAPLYPDIARKVNTQGKVLVQITLDKEGNVISAKAVAGHQMLRSVCEDAAFKSKFKPIRFGNQAVKATGFLNYSFVR